MNEHDQYCISLCLDSNHTMLKFCQHSTPIADSEKSRLRCTTQTDEKSLTFTDHNGYSLRLGSPSPTVVQDCRVDLDRACLYSIPDFHFLGPTHQLQAITW